MHVPQSRSRGKREAGECRRQGNVSDASAIQLWVSWKTNYCLKLCKISVSVRLPLLYSGQRTIPNIGLGCEKKETFVTIRQDKISERWNV